MFLLMFNAEYLTESVLQKIIDSLMVLRISLLGLNANCNNRIPHIDQLRLSFLESGR